MSIVFVALFGLCLSTGVEYKWANHDQIILWQRDDLEIHNRTIHELRAEMNRKDARIKELESADDYIRMSPEWALPRTSRREFNLKKQVKTLESENESKDERIREQDQLIVGLRKALESRDECLRLQAKAANGKDQFSGICGEVLREVMLLKSQQKETGEYRQDPDCYF